MSRRNLPRVLRTSLGFLLATGLALAAAISLTLEQKEGDDKPAEETKAKDKKYEVEFQPDVVYGNAAGEELTLDLAKPKGIETAVPGLVFIHGGSWQGGDKSDYSGLAQEAAAAGYVAVSINYRLAPKHRFPAQVEDCKCAVRWMRANSAELKVDRDRIGAIGRSSGGHLAMMLGVMDPSDGREGDGGSRDQSSKVQAVVSYFGPTHLIGSFSIASQQILRVFLGGSMDENRQLYLQASPIRYVNPGDSPMLLFAGTKDGLVDYDQAFQMATALTDAGVPGRVEFLIGAGHDFSPREMKRTLREAMEFLDEILRGEGDDLNSRPAMPRSLLQ